MDKGPMPNILLFALQRQWNIVFACDRNTCQSPMVERVFHKHFPGRRVCSAGYLEEARKSYCADYGWIALEHETGIHLKGHRSHHIRNVVLRGYTLLVATSSAAGETLRNMGLPRSTVTSMNLTNPEKAGEIRRIEDYRECFSDICQFFDLMLRKKWGYTAALCKTTKQQPEEEE